MSAIFEHATVFMIFWRFFINFLINSFPTGETKCDY